MAEPKSVRSVERAISILLSFTRQRPTLSVSELEKIVALARPTLYRLLGTLEEKGLVRAVGDPRRYELGYKVVEMANLWLSEALIVRVSRPFLEGLWQDTDETVALMIPLSPIQRLCAVEFKSRQALSFSYGIGHTGAMYLGASGKAMLANMPMADVNVALKEAAARAGISGPVLSEELERIRRDGYFVSEGEVTLGAIAIASPIFNAVGGVMGSVGLYGPEARLKRPERREYIERVCNVASQISIALGFIPSHAQVTGTKSSRSRSPGPHGEVTRRRTSSLGQ